MELIYIYIKSAYGEDYNLQFNFSKHTKISYDPIKNELIDIDVRDTSRVPDNFFSNNIINISAIVGSNGAGKSTLMNFLAFSGQVKNQDNNKYFIIYKQNADYFIEGNIDEVLERKVYKRFFDRGTINIKFHNISCVEDTKASQLIYLKINSSEPCGNRNMFERSWSKTPNKLSLFDFLTSLEFKDTFAVFKRNTLRINFTEFEYLPHLTFKSTKEDLIDYVQSSAPRAAGILDIPIGAFIFDQLKKNQKSQEDLKKNFVLSVYQTLYKNIILFIYSWLYDDRNIGQQDQFLGEKYKKTLDIVNGCFPIDDDTIWFNDLPQLKLNLERLLSNEISSLINEDLDVRYDFQTIYEKITNLEDLIEQINKEFFQKNNWLEVDLESLSEPQKENFSNFIQQIIELENKEIYEFSTFIFSEFSSGEEYLIKSFAQLHTKLVNQSGLTCVLLLDEYELHYHPEWARLFLSYLIKFLENYPDTKFQIIMTTHSPYLISDLPKENISLLSIVDGKREINYPQKSFASNYYDLLKDNFFLQDTVGQFAKETIEKCITELIEISEKITEQTNKIIDSSEDAIYFDSKTEKEKLDRIKSICSLIDDRFIHDRLQGMCLALEKEFIGLSSSEQLKKELQEIEDRRDAIKKQLESMND